MALTWIYWVILIKCRHFHKEWHVSCFLSPIVFSNQEDASSVCDHVWTQDRFDKFLSSLRHDSAVAYIYVLFCWVMNRLEVFLPCVTIYFYFVFEGRLEIWLQTLININYGQLHQYFECLKTFHRFDHQFDQNFMFSLILFVFGADFNLPSMLIILNKSRSIVDECALNIAARLLPWLLFVVELESHDKYDQFIDIYSNKTWLFRSLQVVCAARCLNLQGYLPYTHPKVIFSRNIHIIRSLNNQGRGITKFHPVRSISQIKQSPFARSEINLDWFLMKQDDGLALPSHTFQG